MTRDEIGKLERAVAGARRRRDSAAPGSPEWDAATDAVIDFEARLSFAVGGGVPGPDSEEPRLVGAGARR